MSEVTKKGEKVTSREARCGSSGGLLISTFRIFYCNILHLHMSGFIGIGIDILIDIIKSLSLLMLILHYESLVSLM